MRVPEPKAASADLLGEAVPMPPPRVETQVPAMPAGGAMPEPAPAEDENQPGFIGERNLPHP